MLGFESPGLPWAEGCRTYSRRRLRAVPGRLLQSMTSDKGRRTF